MPRINASSLAEHREVSIRALLVAFDELLAERPIDLITLSDIATRAGMARSTVYNYAADKVALLALAVADAGVLLQVEARAIKDDPSLTAPERVTALIRFLLDAFGSGARRIFALQSHLGVLPEKDRDLAGEPFRELHEVLTSVVGRGIANGEFLPSDDLSVDVDLISGVMESAVRMTAADPTSTERTAARAALLINRALGSGEGELVPRG